MKAPVASRPCAKRLEGDPVFSGLVIDLEPIWSS
jgi:hypothetical protein